MKPVTKKTNMCKDNLKPDPELLIWEKWIKIRKDETEHLAKKTGQPAADLAMNALEKVRKEKETKTVLEHSQVERKVTIRNTTWEQPQRLKQKCYSDPVYEVQRTRAELGRPRIIEHIGVPKRIQEKEKGITGVSIRKSGLKLDSSFRTYKEKRQKELEINIKKIDPFRPEIDDLIVLGKKPKPSQDQFPLLPTISVTSFMKIEEEECSIYAVRINNTIFLKDTESRKVRHLKEMQSESWNETCSSWSYYFNCPINRVGRSDIILHNLGTVTLRYCWKKIKVPFEDTEDQMFFFNKNENVIFPGQRQNIPITFISNGPGSFSESWEIIFLNVYFFDTQNKHHTFHLHADSVDNTAKIKRKIHKLENIVYNKALKNIARDLLSEIVTIATSIEPQIYSYKKMFLEAEMFVLKNPNCFYHQTEVTKLKDMFIEMAPKEIWDLSITSWRTTMINKDFDDRIKYYEQLRKIHRECLKPWYEQNDLVSQKHEAVKQLLGQMADKFDAEYNSLTKMQDLFYIEKEINENSKQEIQETNTHTSVAMRNIFYIKVYEHVATTIESCVGLLSSLDLNRWIHFDFCHS